MEFGNVLKDTLRRSDIVHQWRQNRYFVVLTRLSQEDIEEVISRILTSFKDSGYADRVDIKYTSSLIRKDCHESKE